MKFPRTTVPVTPMSSTPVSPPAGFPFELRPPTAMMFRAEGPRVAVVDTDSKVHLRPITIGRDFGATLEILGGLDVNDQIIINPADSLEEGQKVRVAKPNAGDGRS